MTKPSKPVENKPAESNNKKETSAPTVVGSGVAVAAAAAEVTKIEVDVKGLRTELEKRGIKRKT